MAPPFILRHLGRRDYLPVWEAMQAFTRERGPQTPDEVWLVEHPPVFTLGLNGRPEHLLAPGDIPVLPVDRGGQVTYHGPGQLVAYLLIDLRRRGMGVRHLIDTMEQAIIGLLDGYGIAARARADAPGVYVAGAKIASLGLRVRRGCSYHGLSLNVDVDLEPFARINPCGYQGLAVTRLRDLGVTDGSEAVGERLVEQLRERLAPRPAVPSRPIPGIVPPSPPSGQTP